MELVSGNVFIRPMRFEQAGDVVDGHAHNFDHTTYVVRGALRIEALDAEGKVVRSVDRTAGNWVLIKAGVVHRLTALEDHSMGHCIYAHRTPQGDIVQEWDGWEKAYV